MPPRLFAGDVELGKRDDDHRPGTKSPLALAWQHRRIPHGLHRRTLKRVSLGIAAFIAFYYFFKFMPTDLEPPRQRPSYQVPTGNRPPASRPSPSQNGPPSKPGNREGMMEVPLHDFNGPIKFYHLAGSLHAQSRTRGADPINYNVLFAAASLKSAAILLPIACEMAIRERNYVHFALMGRDDISMEILKAVNGMTDDCKIIFHDARPDFSLQSSDFRMEVSSSAGFNHINTFVHPQATIIDASGEEEIWFLKGLKERAIAMGRTVIELPEDAAKNLMWLTLLDSASLSAWNKVSVDIVVHAQTWASGSLIRLLDSLGNADFFSSAPPRLTIELPHVVDESSRAYLQNYRWPPPLPGKIPASLLTLHHRIPQQGLTAEENSIRLLESFWPADPSSSHVLLLSPQVELSPLFFHYLKYSMLEYKYSSSNSHNLNENLLGISLDLPSTYLNDSTKFTPPVGNVSITSNSISSDSIPFLWQSPNSNAQLYFGDKWMELHSFISHLLKSSHKLPTPTTLNLKDVSKTYPSWLEHFLKLARARGYWTIYPNFSPHDSISTTHNELYQPPPEYTSEVLSETATIANLETGELTADPSNHHLSLKNKEKALITTPLLSILPLKGELPKISEMPLLSWDGERIDIDDIGDHAVEYSDIFRREIGGCTEDADEKERRVMDARDLFCLDDEVIPEEETDESEEVEKDVKEDKGEAKKSVGKEDGIPISGAVKIAGPTMSSGGV